MARTAAPRLLGALALGVLALLGLAREAVAAPVPELSIVEDWKIEGVYDTSSGLGLSYGVFFDPYTHDEYMYIVHNTTVDMYHLPSSRGLGEPVLERSFSTGSSCAQSSSWVMWPNLITTHGDLPFCTCAWSEDDPCPKRVSITGTTTGEDGLYELGVNNILKVDQVPLVEGALGLGFSSTNETAEDRTWACEPLINPEAVAGKYCVVDRGGCFFQTKHDHCLEAGAIGTVIVNRDPSVITLSVQEVAKGHPFFMVGSDTGDIMKNNPDATIASGKPIGEPEPQPGYSGPDGLSIVNVYTGKRVNWYSPYITADQTIYDGKTEIMYAIVLDGNTANKQAMAVNMTTNPPSSMGVFDIPGEADIKMFYRGDKTYWTDTNAWDGIVDIYSLADPLLPEFLSSTNYTMYCPEMSFGGPVFHPNGMYMYLMGGILEESCPDLDGDGEPDWKVDIYDISDAANPELVGEFIVPEMEVGTLVLNGNEDFSWGPNGLAGIDMGSAGMVFYDFSDPVNPVPVTTAYDVNPDHSNDFTKGIFGAVYGNDGHWYVREKEAQEGLTSEFHSIQLVPPEDICL